MFLTKWPKAHDDALKDFFALGMSFAEIAAAINEKFNGTSSYSRNATIGRASRIGLTNNQRKKAKKQLLQKRAVLAPHRAPRKRRPSRPMITPQEVQFQCSEIVPHHVPLLELHANDCRWPYGEGSIGTVKYSFCGHERAGDHTMYCGWHFVLSLRQAA